MRHGRIALALSALVLLGFPAGASAGPAEDFAAVFEDWRADGDIESCRWTVTQLESAALVTQLVSDLAYSDFPAEVARELGRLRPGRCATGGGGSTQQPQQQSRTPLVTPAQPPSPAARAESPVGRLRIARFGIRGSARREYVRLVNTGGRSVRLSRSTLRTGRRLRLRLPRTLLLRPGRAVTIYVRCARGKRRTVVRGSRVYACSRRRSLFSDRGDIVQLLDAAGTVVSQRGAGTRARVPRF